MRSSFEWSIESALFIFLQAVIYSFEARTTIQFCDDSLVPLIGLLDSILNVGFFSEFDRNLSRESLVMLMMGLSDVD